jgi:hypothetical protein
VIFVAVVPAAVDCALAEVAWALLGADCALPELELLLEHAPSASTTPADAIPTRTLRILTPFFTSWPFVVEK